MGIYSFLTPFVAAGLLLGSLQPVVQGATAGVVSTQGEQESYEALVKRNAKLKDADALQRLLGRKKPVMWLFLGDSITHGAMHTKGGRDYVDHLEELIRWERRAPQRIRDCVVNAGVSGDTLTRFFDERSWRLLPEKADVVLVNFGVNDVRSRICREGFEKQLRRLVKQIRGDGGIVVLQVPTMVRGMKQRDWDFRASVRGVAEEMDCLLVDHPLFWKEVGQGNVLAVWMNDALHPNKLGHRAMAQAVARALGIAPANAAMMRLPLR